MSVHPKAYKILPLASMVRTLKTKQKNQTQLTYFCLIDAPVYLSFPHFYQADQSLLEPFEGLTPDKEKHETYFKIQPVRLLSLIPSYKFTNFSEFFFRNSVSLLRVRSEFK